MRIFAQRPRIVVGCALVLALAALAGCGGGGGNKDFSLSGKVTYKGQPVTGGTMTFTPIDGKTLPVTTPIDSKGGYSLVPPALGELKVAIETESVSRNMYPNRTDIDTSNFPKYVQIPFKYTNIQDSGLTVTIHEGKNEKDFDLTD